MDGYKHYFIGGDTHCGHLVGLTPPQWQIKKKKDCDTKRSKWYKIAIQLWNAFAKELMYLPYKFDGIFLNGDLVEGKGKRSGGTELITTDMQEQSSMAVAVINYIRRYAKPKAPIILTYGTPYHTDTEGDEWENIVARKAAVTKIGAHEWVDANGLIVDLKHHIPTSAVPYSRFTAVSRDALWNELWALVNMQPKADLIVRSHAHYYVSCEDSRKAAMVLPALQGMGSKFGAKRCSALVDWGFVVLHVKNKDVWNFTKHLRRIEAQKPKVVKL